MAIFQVPSTIARFRRIPHVTTQKISKTKKDLIELFPRFPSYQKTRGSTVIDSKNFPVRESNPGLVGESHKS